MGIRLVLGFLSILASMALVLIIFGQRQSEDRLLEKQVLLTHKVSTKVNGRGYVHKLLLQEHSNRKKELEELEANVNKLVREMEKKKSDSEVCQAEKKGKNEELEPIQKEHTDIEATFKAESETWTEEITKLNQQIVQPSKVCEFVRKDLNVTELAFAKTLCAAKTENVTLVL